MKDIFEKDEKELLDSFDQGEWISVKAEEEEQIVAIAKYSLQKNKRINIRLSESDLIQIKARAAQEGMPYQTLVSSIIQKFVSGRLKEAS